MSHGHRMVDSNELPSIYRDSTARMIFHFLKNFFYFTKFYVDTVYRGFFYRPPVWFVFVFVYSSKLANGLLRFEFAQTYFFRKEIIGDL